MILSAAAMLAACTTKQTYTINGHIEGDSMDLFNGIAILTSRDSENPTKDTVQIRENKFKFEGTIQTPVFHYISIPGISGVLPIFLENADYVITGHQDSLPKAKIEGGESQQLIKEYNNKIDEVSNRYNIRELIRDMRVPTTTEERKAEAESLYYACQEELSKYKDSMMKAHPLTHFYLNMFHNDMRDMELAEVIKIKDEFKADAKARGAVPMSAFGEQKLSKFFRGIYKPSPLQSMFTAFNAINNPVESLTQRAHPLVQGAGVAVEKGLNTSNLTTNLFKPEDVRYRPYNTDQYQPNINLNDKEFNPLTYTAHKMNPFDRPMNTYLRTPGKVKRGEAQLSDFLPSVFQPDFSKK